MTSPKTPSLESMGVKRYALDARLNSFMTGPYDDGEYVLYSDIAHLLNPTPKTDVAGDEKTTFQKAAQFFYDGMLTASNEKLLAELAIMDQNLMKRNEEYGELMEENDRLRVALERVEKMSRLKGYPTPSEWAHLLDTTREALAQSKLEPGE